MLFSRICNLTLPEQEHMDFRFPLGWDTTNSKFELNLPSHSRDMLLQSLPYLICIFVLLFETLFEIIITFACFNGLP